MVAGTQQPRDPSQGGARWIHLLPGPGRLPFCSHHPGSVWHTCMSNNGVDPIRPSRYQRVLIIIAQIKEKHWALVIITQTAILNRGWVEDIFGKHFRKKMFKFTFGSCRVWAYIFLFDIVLMVVVLSPRRHTTFLIHIIDSALKVTGNDIFRA